MTSENSLQSVCQNQVSVCVCVCVTVIHLPLTKSFVPQTQLEPNCTIPVAVLGKQRACPASRCREGCEVPA